MRKLLSLLGAVVISATTASSVVACSDMYNKESKNPSYVNEDHTYDAYTVAAGLIARSKSLIVDDMFGFDDAKTKSYALDNNSIGDLVNVNNSNIASRTIGDEYSSFIDDSTLTNIKNLNLKGTIGDEGGIITFAGQKAIDGLVGLLPSAVQGVVKGLVPQIENLLGLNGDASSVAEAMKPILQAMGKLDTKVAMEGIPFALGLIPDLGSYKTIFQLVKLILPTLLNKNVKVAIDNALDGLVKDADISNYKSDKLPAMTQDLAALLGKIMDDAKTNTGQQSDVKDKDNMFANILKFISLAGDYMSFFEHDSKDSVLSQMGTNKDKTVGDSIFYKGDGKAFNLAPVLNEAAYYLGNGITEDKTLKLCQILFLTSDGSSISLNPIGKMVIDGPILKIVNKLKGAEAITTDQAEKIFLDVLQNKVSDDVTKSLFGDKPFDTVFNDWGQIGSIKNGETKIGDSILNSSIMQRIFLNDVTNKSSTMSLKNLLSSVDLYKLLMADVQNKGDDSINPGFGEKALQDNNGILPNYAGHYTQESIADLAVDLNSMFGLNSATSTNEELQYHFFDFSNLKKVVDELLFDAPENSADVEEPLIDYLVDHLGDTNAAGSIGKALGYYVDGNGNINPKFVKVKSWMGDLISTLVPKMEEDVNEKASAVVTKSDGNYYQDKALTESLLGESDALKFFVGGLTNFVSDIIEGTDYTYWFNKVLTNGFDNYGNDPENDSVWYYQDKDRPVWEPINKYGIQTDYFDAKKTLVKSMSLTIKFDLSKMPSLISKLAATGSKIRTYKITISRSTVNDALAFTDVQRG